MAGNDYPSEDLIRRVHQTEGELPRLLARYTDGSFIGAIFEDDPAGEGAVVASVERDTPAERAGLKKDDLVVAVSKGVGPDRGDLARELKLPRGVYSAEELRDQLAVFPSDSLIVLNVSRGDVETQVEISIGKHPREPIAELFSVRCWELLSGRRIVDSESRQAVAYDAAYDAIRRAALRRNMQKLGDRWKYMAWLRMHARQATAQYFRRRGEVPRDVRLDRLDEDGIWRHEVVAGRDPGPDNVLMAAELSKFVSHVLSGLKEKDREIIELFYWKELTYTEVAEKIGITPVAARKRKDRADERFRKLYDIAADEERGR